MAEVKIEENLPVQEMERIIDSYKEKLLRMCYLYLKDKTLAEDALQDIYLKIYQKYTSFSGNSSEKTWIMRIAINVCKNYRKAFWYRRITSSEALEQLPAPEDTEEHRDNRRVTEEVMNLTPKYKEVVLLYYYQHLKTAEIASVLSIPESTVYVRLKRARDQLKTKLKGWYYNE